MKEKINRPLCSEELTYLFVPQKKVVDNLSKPYGKVVCWLEDISEPGMAVIFSNELKPFASNDSKRRAFPGIAIALVDPGFLTREVALADIDPKVGSCGEQALISTEFAARIHSSGEPIMPALKASYPKTTMDVDVDLKPLGAIVASGTEPMILWGTQNGEPVVWEQVSNLKDVGHISRYLAGGKLFTGSEMVPKTVDWSVVASCIEAIRMPITKELHRREEEWYEERGTYKYSVPQSDIEKRREKRNLSDEGHSL